MEHFQEEPRGERGSERPRDREQQDPSSQGEHHWPHLCQQFLSRLVSSSVFETSVSLCIVLNTLFLAMEHHGISQGLQQVLQVGNKVGLNPRDGEEGDDLCFRSSPPFSCWRRY